MIQLYGPDFLQCGKEMFNMSVRKSGTGVKERFSIESEVSSHSGLDFDPNSASTGDVRYFFKDLSPQDIDDLLTGKAYLEFWLKTINNREPSGNRKLYTEEDIRGAIPGFFGNCLKAGGVPGRFALVHGNMCSKSC